MARSQHLLKLAFSPPDGREIHLVGALSQLRHSRKLVRTSRLDAHLKVERCQEFLEIGCASFETVPFHLLLVERAALTVFFGRSPAVKRPNMIQECGKFARTGGQRQSQN